jgi:hypothetical protein
MSDYFDLPPVPNIDEAEPGTRDYDTLEWCDERLRRGIQFVENSMGYDKISLALDQLFMFERSVNTSWIPGAKSPLSNTRANLIAKIAEDLTASLTDVRMFWNYRTQNAKYEEQCRLSNKSAEIWYNRRQIDLRIGDVIRYYTIAGTGFAHLYYSRRLDDLMVDAEDPRNVYPIDPMSYHSIQDCSGVIIRRPRTPEWVKEEYNKIVNTDEGGGLGTFFGWMHKTMVEGPGERGGPLSKRAKSDKNIPGTPTVFVNTMFLKDNRINKKDKILRAGPWEDGKPLTPWSYEIRPGDPLFPFGRMIVWGNRVVMYDNTSPYWMAKFPLIKFTLNPWPFSWFGKAPLWDCIPLENSLNNNLRVIDDHSAQVAQPGAVADRNVSKAEMNKFNTRAPGYKIRTNLSSGKGITIVNPPPLDPLIWEIIKWCQETMQKISGTADPSAMASLAQIPSDDTIDTIMKAMTPGVRLRSRILEGCYKDLAEMFLWCNAEWDSLMKRIAKLGPQAITKEDFDYNPRTFIPDNVPDGEPGDVAGMEDALGLDNPAPLHVRAKMMLESIACEFDPSSLLNTAAQQELMKYFMLAKMGYVSVFTLMEKMGIMNFAPPSLVVPPDEISRLKLQQGLGIGMIANAQGRKSTDQAPPGLGNNANGPTITTS